MRPIGLAAQAIPGCAPWDLIEIAAAAGFDRVGIAIDPDDWDGAKAVRTRTALRDTGIVLQDVEVIRLDHIVDDAMRRLLDIAIDLRAIAVITIALSDNAARTSELLEELVDHCAGTPTTPILEFGRFSGVPTLAKALAIANTAGAPVLVDPLHLTRAGDDIAGLTRVADVMLPYAQICDARRPPASNDRATLLKEARDHRRNLGDGILDLRGYVAALPLGLPLMNEVRSRAIVAAWPDPLSHAEMLARTMRTWLAQQALAA